EEEWTDEARRYYCNIVGKYGPSVQGILKKAAALEIKTICPLHGPVLSENLGYYLEKYERWSSYTPEEDGVVIACASIHGNTMSAAKQLKAFLEAEGKKVILHDLSRADLAQAVADVFRYSKLVLASSTYDAGIFSPMQDFLYRLKAKGAQKRAVGFIENGSWAPQAAKQMSEAVALLKDMTAIEPVVTLKGAVTEENKIQLKALAEALA
ncbi:MAG: FprA family A-type flavoprotein, partial [Clostridia bacterium]|nr:FprA family A-type flavoprotein [Clostridia bacterium]